MIFALVGFVIGFATGAMVNETQNKNREKFEERKKNKEKTESNEGLEKTETKSSYVDYTKVDDISEEELPKWEVITKTEFEEHEAEGLSSEYESIDLYFNIATGVCSDEDKEPVNAWEDLVGDETKTRLLELVGKSYESFPITDRVFYVKNNDVDTYFRISVFSDTNDV